mmetsp:Transcript_92891/g.248560  ORF Transcript_92891/g.248560 Transcript_92891/m.248560 type:complete len:611 (-) Transcript_92891:580-2412(-)
MSFLPTQTAGQAAGAGRFGPRLCNLLPSEVEDQTEPYECAKVARTQAGAPSDIATAGQSAAAAGAGGSPAAAEETNGGEKIDGVESGGPQLCSVSEDVADRNLILSLSSRSFHLDFGKDEEEYLIGVAPTLVFRFRVGSLIGLILKLVEMRQNDFGAMVQNTDEIWPWVVIVFSAVHLLNIFVGIVGPWGRLSPRQLQWLPLIVVNGIACRLASNPMRAACLTQEHSVAYVPEAEGALVMALNVAQVACIIFMPFRSMSILPVAITLPVLYIAMLPLMEQGTQGVSKYWVYTVVTSALAWVARALNEREHRKYYVLHRREQAARRKAASGRKEAERSKALADTHREEAEKQKSYAVEQARVADENGAEAERRRAEAEQAQAELQVRCMELEHLKKEAEQLLAEAERAREGMRRLEQEMLRSSQSRQPKPKLEMPTSLSEDESSCPAPKGRKLRFGDRVKHRLGSRMGTAVRVPTGSKEIQVVWDGNPERVSVTNAVVDSCSAEEPVEDPVDFSGTWVAEMGCNLRPQLRTLVVIGEEVTDLGGSVYPLVRQGAATFCRGSLLTKEASMLYRDGVSGSRVRFVLCGARGPIGIGRSPAVDGSTTEPGLVHE